MAFNYEYPYTDAHRHNDDWLINKVKELALEWVKTSGEWTETREAYSELKNYIADYFKNLDVQEEINVKLETMASDGTLRAVIAPLFNEYQQNINVLSSRMDAFTRLDEGASTGDAELTDARVDYTGKEWENVGGHIRAIGNQLSSEIANGTTIKNEAIDISKIKGVKGLEYYIIPKKYCNVNTSEIVDNESISLLWVNTQGKRWLRITNNDTPLYYLGYYWVSDTLFGDITRIYGQKETGFVDIKTNSNWALFNIQGVNDYNINIESPNIDGDVDCINNEHIPYKNMFIKNSDIVAYGKTRFGILNYADGIGVWRENDFTLSVSRAFTVGDVNDKYYANYDVPCVLVYSNDLQTYKGYCLNLGNNFNLTAFNGIESGDKVFFVSTNDNNIVARNKPIFKAPVTINPNYINLDNKVDNSWFYGKVGAGLGDSLTAITNNWRTIVENQLGCIINNNGIGGTSMRGTNENAMHQDVRINAISTEVDFIVIFAGTNDSYGNAPSPTEYEYSNIDTSTFIGAYNVCISKILYRFGYGALYDGVNYSGLTNVLDTPKNVKIFLVAPPFQYRGDNEEVALSGALNSYRYAKTVREIANGWNLPLIDVNATCGINRLTYSVYLSDGVHPNTDGQFLIGNAVTNGLLANTPREDNR